MKHLFWYIVTVIALLAFALWISYIIGTSDIPLWLKIFLLS